MQISWSSHWYSKKGHARNFEGKSLKATSSANLKVLKSLPCQIPLLVVPQLSHHYLVYSRSMCSVICFPFPKSFTLSHRNIILFHTIQIEEILKKTKTNAQKCLSKNHSLRSFHNFILFPPKDSKPAFLKGPFSQQQI